MLFVAAVTALRLAKHYNRSKSPNRVWQLFVALITSEQIRPPECIHVQPANNQKRAVQLQDEDLALAKALQEQERAFLQLQGESPGEFGYGYAMLLHCLGGEGAHYVCCWCVASKPEASPGKSLLQGELL